MDAKITRVEISDDRALYSFRVSAILGVAQEKMGEIETVGVLLRGAPETVGLHFAPNGRRPIPAHEEAMKAYHIIQAAMDNDIERYAELRGENVPRETGGE